MARFTVTRSVEPATAARLLEARDDIVRERPAGPGAETDTAPGGSGSLARRFELDDGPFSVYSRTIVVEGPGSGADAQVEVTETYRFELPVGTWRFLMTPVMRIGLRRDRHRGTTDVPAPTPWWYPPERPDARAAGVLGLLATLTLVLGYVGVLLSQTMTFAADDFGAGTAAQGNALAAVRVGGLLAIGLAALADRRGRRLILLVAVLTSIGATVAGAFAPDLVALVATQAVNRGAWAAGGIVLAIIVAEEMPAGSRAYALSLIALTGGLGAGITLWLLPLAGLGPHAWRILYVVPLAFVYPVLRLGRLIPESRRFDRAHRNVPLAGHYWRLALVAGATCLLNIFLTPTTQFLNEFLRHERGMNAGMVSLFGLVTGTPAAIGVLVGGRLADTRGRRVVAAGAVLAGTALTVLGFVFAGLGMWLCAIVGGIFTAALVPTLGVYGPELFPTSLRGRANGIISVVAMGGSVIGLVAAGYLRDAFGSFGRAFTVLSVAPLLLAAMVLGWFPETARRELEEINPEDRTSPGALSPDGGRAVTVGEEREEGEADAAKPLAL